MYMQNRRNSSKFKGCSPLQNPNGLIGLKPAIPYCRYTKPLATILKKQVPDKIIIICKLRAIKSYDKE